MILFREFTYRATQEAKCSATFVVAGEAACGRVAILSLAFLPHTSRLTMQVSLLARTRRTVTGKRSGQIFVLSGEEQIWKLHIFISFPIPSPPL